MMNKVDKPFAVPDDFELQLLIRMSEPGIRRAYICSPCRAESEMELHANIKAARFYMYLAFKNLDVLPRALHAFVIYDENRPAERALALKHGRELLAQCDVLFVCGRTITSGMHDEINDAAVLRIPIVVFCPLLKDEAREIAAKAGAETSLVCGSGKAPLMTLSPDKLQAAI